MKNKGRGTYTKRCRGGPYLVDKISEALDTRDTVEFWVRYICVFTKISKGLFGEVRISLQVFYLHYSGFKRETKCECDPIVHHDVIFNYTTPLKVF